MEKVEDFQGAFGAFRGGLVLVNKGIQGGYWMKNTNGVVMRLEPKRKGVALSLGADGVVVELEK